MKEYKVLSQKDKWFTGKFDPELLEKALNAYAQQGWAVVSSVTASIPGFTGTREELVIIMERDKSRPSGSPPPPPSSTSTGGVYSL